MLELIAGWDGAALLFIQEHLRFSLGNILLPLWSNLGNAGLIWIAAALVMLCFRRTRRAGVLALAAMLINLLAVNVVLKHLVSRTRPWLVVDGLVTLLRSSDPNSFPSGHTSASFAFAVSLCRHLDVTWGKVLAVAAAVLMGWSRLYVGVHFPSDVLAGAVIGTLCALLAAWLYRRFFQARFPLGGPGRT